MKIARLSVLVLILTAAFAFVSADRQVASAQACGPNVTYVVRPGENLFRISLNHGTTFTAVAAANGIYDVTRVYPGQVLVMVCAGGGMSSAGVGVANTQITTNVLLPTAPPPAQTVAVPVIPPTVDCTGFRITHPRDGFAARSQDFYWDGAPGATSYRVTIFNADLNPGALVASQDVSGIITTTRIPVSPDFIGAGFRFSYRVQALVADTVVCSTPLITLFRAVG